MADEFPRERLTIEVEKSRTAEEAASTSECLSEARGEPESVRGDDGPESIAEAAEGRLAGRGSEAPHIAPGRPWEDAEGEPFDGRSRAEPPGREVSEAPKQAKAILEGRRPGHDRRRPRDSPGYRPPAGSAAARIGAGAARFPATDAVMAPDAARS